MTTIVRAPSYTTALRAIAEFMLKQDVNSASRRLEELLKEIEASLLLMQQRPELSRRYNPPAAKNKQAREKNEQLASLKQEFKVAQVHERVLEHHSLLYGLGATDIVLLSIKHQRQATYPLAAEE
jgi:hypothetical protein